jgi:hypothetical protein
MKNKIICYLIPFLLLGCSKQPQVIPSALPFKVTVVKTFETKELIDLRTQVMTLLEAKDYNQLDALAAKLRSSKEKNADGTWKLSGVYYALGISNNIFGMPMFNNIPDTAFEDRIAELQDWVSVKPESITARVALANVQIDYAWNARGSDYASTVTDKGWQMFGERLNEAAKTLREAKKIDEKCPWYWYEMMSIAVGMQLPKDQFNEIFNQAISYEPNFIAYYGSRANFLLPRWYGNQGEWENDLAKSADKIGGDDGDVLYAQVVWRVNRNTKFDNIFRENNLSWPRVKKGFEVLEKRYPNSLAVKNEAAYLAFYAQDAPTARKYFDEAEGQMDKSIWQSQDEFLQFATYAYTH